jgi:hypothetical protein
MRIRSAFKRLWIRIRIRIRGEKRNQKADIIYKQKNNLACKCLPVIVTTQITELNSDPEMGLDPRLSKRLDPDPDLHMIHADQKHLLPVQHA